MLKIKAPGNHGQIVSKQWAGASPSACSPAHSSVPKNSSQLSRLASSARDSGTASFSATSAPESSDWDIIAREPATTFQKGEGSVCSPYKAAFHFSSILFCLMNSKPLMIPQVKGCEFSQNHVMSSLTSILYSIRNGQALTC